MQVVLRDDQVLLIGGDGALRTHDLNGRRGPDLSLAFGIFQSLLRIGERFLLHANVLVGEYQIPVHVFDLVDSREHLQAEGYVGDFTVVFCNPDKPCVG